MFWIFFFLGGGAMNEGLPCSWEVASFFEEEGLPLSA